MPTSTARITTPNGSKYMQQLCKHFAHKVEVTFDAHKAHAALPTGPADMVADETGASFTVVADNAETLIRAKDIVERHLLTFTFREKIEKLDWQDA